MPLTRPSREYSRDGAQGVKANQQNVSPEAQNTFGPLEMLIVGLQGSGRSHWKDLSKTNIFMWYRCSLLL